MAIESIAKTLGTGSGIDTAALVEELIEAQFSGRTSALTKREETLTAQISAAAELKNAISEFDSALKSLISGGTLKTQPTSSNTALLKVSALADASVAGLSASVEVRQIAEAQAAHVAPVADKTAAIGQGTLTLTFGTATVVDGAMTAFTPGGGTPVEIAIGAADSSLEGIRDAINAKNAGVTASILSDSDGSRLVIKSATGASQAFTLTATEEAGHEGLAALNIGVGATGSTIGTTAQDAVIAVDGVEIHRARNSILDLIPGVRLDLVAASPGTKITLGTEPATDALGQTVADVVESYNELLAMLKTATDPVSGPLRSDPAAKALLRSLGQLSVATLVTGAAEGTPATLAAIGVATNRDGTLKLDSTVLASALANNPDAVAAMFGAGTGLSAALATIAAAASNKTYGLGASEDRYTKAQADLEIDQEKATVAAESMRTRMTRQFANMDTAVASYKATQSFLEQQIDAWNSED